MSVPTAALYFGDDPGLVREFEIDYEKVRGFHTEVGDQCAIACLPCLVPLCWFTCERQNTIDKINATHVAITHDGIRFSVDKHKAGCRCDCNDQGRVTKTVPFDKITDCDITEPAGASGPCCSVKNILAKVVVDTASSGGTSDGITRHELEIEGLVDPHAFKALVWEMKRNYINSTTAGVGGVASAASLTTMSQGAPAPIGDMKRTMEQQADTIDLLKEQNRIQEEQLSVLKQILAKS